MASVIGMERVERAPGTLGRTAGLAVDGTPTRARSMVVAPLVLRLALGSVFFVHGAQKLFGAFGGPGLQGTVAGFRSMGLEPAIALGIAAAVLEFGGSLLLALGLFTRVTAALLCVEMLVALFAVHAPHGFLLNGACVPGRGHGVEFVLTLASMAGALALLGPGAASVDRTRTRRRRAGLPLAAPPRPRQ